MTPIRSRTGRRLVRLDRRTGRALRAAADRQPPVGAAARGAAGALSPAFRLVCLVLTVAPATRSTGLRATAAATTAALAARVLRDAIGRRRPGERAEGGFPSRHAAAATAIVVTVGAERRPLGLVLASAASIGLVGRVISGDHEPADIIAGATLGSAVALAVTRIRRAR